MSNEKFAAEYEKEYFHFCYALQSEEKNIRDYVKYVEDLFEELEKGMKKLAENKHTLPLEIFSIADSCLIGYNNIIKKVTNPIIREYCTKQRKLAKDARVVLSHLFPSRTIDEIFEESKDEKYHSNIEKYRDFTPPDNSY